MPTTIIQVICLGGLTSCVIYSSSAVIIDDFSLSVDKKSDTAHTAFTRIITSPKNCHHEPSCRDDMAVSDRQGAERKQRIVLLFAALHLLY
jgi:hypothetical protein